MPKFTLPLLILTLIALCSCATQPHIVLTARQFNVLNYWDKDLHFEALETFYNSCAIILKQDPNKQPYIYPKNPQFGKLLTWQNACRKIPPEGLINKTIARNYFETNFIPYEIKNQKNQVTGFFTGYYEPMVKGSLTKHPPYVYPLYKTPNNIIKVDLGQFDSKLKNKTIRGILSNNKIIPLYTREQIDNGVLNNQGLELVWTKSPIDNFFIHIQGSGQINLDNGQKLYLSYDNENGHPYFTIGKYLKEKKYLTSPISMQKIKFWLNQNPDKAQWVMQQNPSFIFFKARNEPNPIGAQGIAITPTRSLAIDKNFIPLGIPLWLEVNHPNKDSSKIYRLMIAQNTGEDIQGAIRGDFFWGHGEKAEDYAGKMQSTGRYWALIPKDSSNDNR